MTDPYTKKEIIASDCGPQRHKWAGDLWAHFVPPLIGSLSGTNGTAYGPSEWFPFGVQIVGIWRLSRCSAGSESVRLGSYRVSPYGPRLGGPALILFLVVFLFHLISNSSDAYGLDYLYYFTPYICWSCLSSVCGPCPATLGLKERFRAGWTAHFEIGRREEEGSGEELPSTFPLPPGPLSPPSALSFSEGKAGVNSPGRRPSRGPWRKVDRTSHGETTGWIRLSPTPPTRRRLMLSLNPRICTRRHCLLGSPSTPLGTPLPSSGSIFVIPTV